MAYTDTDLTEIEEAIRKLQKGERVASVTYDGKTVRYTEVELDELLTLRDRIKSELQTSGKSRLRQVRLNTRKGIC